ncbi:DJ-1/PfpI family protein [Allokutzneria albata]|uniref:DJ-1/PfpI family protein n=1 Tax=Allokutzneria albata TaxID=211114 RepID=A0A1H0BQP3_ALLAB|nr:DJ-1/PfpI family protein [Allokutzneria albata]SDN47960.1 DJ-1/PfpI family protein [Allokutzneria albata]
MRTFLRALAALIAVLLVPGVSAAVSVTSTFGAFHAPGPERAVPAAAPIQHDPAKPTAVVLVGELGAVISDVLVPYEILASTGRFNVYTVAARRVLLPLTGGLDLVPDLTFDDPLARTPDLVVVPALPDVGQPSTAPITDWLRVQSARGAQMLTVCNGAGVLASAGLLDGRRATAHWLRLNRFEANYPKVNWVRGARYVDDGTLVSTGGILSSVDGTLHMIERLAGPAVAANAAAAVRWRHYRAGPPVSSGLALPDVVAIFNGGYRWSPSTVGVLLTNGVGEIELASVFEPHSQSLAARTLALSTDGGPVRSRHGLTFVPRGDVAGAAPRLDRLLVPGSARIAPVPGAPAPEYVHDGGFAFDATLRDLARNIDVATARWTAKVLELPTNGLVLEGPAWPWGPTLLPFALILLGVAVVAVVRKRPFLAKR